MPEGAGETGLSTLLRTLEPRLQPGRWVFETRPTQTAPPPSAAMVFSESEGMTLVMPAVSAAEGPRSGVFAWITCEVWSSLEAVGMLAAIARALADRGIPVNVVSAYYHDHLFVPEDRAQAALDALGSLAEDG